MEKFLNNEESEEIVSDAEDSKQFIREKTKNSRTKWLEVGKLDNSYISNKIPFFGNSGPINPVWGVPEAFKLSFGSRIMETIVQETNHYATNLINSNQGNIKPRFTVLNVKNVNVDELYALFDMQMLMGLLKNYNKIILQKKTFSSWQAIWNSYTWLAQDKALHWKDSSHKEESKTHQKMCSLLQADWQKEGNFILV